MTIKVEKRDKEIEQFDREKIKLAVMKAMKDMETVDEESAEKVAKKAENKVKQYLKEWRGTDTIAVDIVHKMVENSIMDVKLYDVAREYIGYRKEHKPDIFRKRIAYKPFSYPELAKYVDAIQQSYWIVSEYSFGGDIQDFRVTLTPEEKESVRRSMLAISQVEVAVKEFWGKIGDRLPVPEIQEVGATFAESECRHSRAYSHLLEILGLNNEFEGVLEVPAIKKRVNYAQKALAKAKTDSNKDFVESVLLFSLFIENVSLFSQFLIISQMNKEKGVLKGISNVISSTSLEEATHHDFGCALVNTIREENPEWFDDELEERLNRLVMQAFEAEEAIVDWIFEEGELPYLSRDEVVEYIKNRFNMGLQQAGFKPAFEVDESLIERTTWFDLQNTTTTHVDFFAKRPQNYTKFSKAFDGDDLF